MSVLIEELSDLEHRQWISWTQYIVENHDIPEALEQKWRNNWEPYQYLPEDEKEKDRKWGRKAIQVIKECGRSTDETVCPECGEVSHFRVLPDCYEEEWYHGCRDEKARCSNCDFKEKGENLTEKYTKTLVEVEN